MKKLLSVLHSSQRSNKNNRSLKGGITVYNEPDWSSLTLTELLEKAQEFGKKAYSSSLSTHAFLMRAMEASPKYSTITMEIAELAQRTQQVYQILAEVNRGITRLVPEPPSSNNSDEME